MDVSIIVVNYNTEKLILNCLDSICEKTEGLDFEIIVVDNNSPNKPQVLKVDSRIEYIQSETNLGFGKANNLGAQYAKGKYLFCLNPDTILINNAVKELYKFMIEHKDIGICGANLYQANMSAGHSYEMLSPGIRQEIINSRHCSSKRYNEDFNITNSPKEVAHVVGAALMISKKLFNEIGGFDKDFFMYLEETYLCYQVKQKGYRIYNVPSAKIIHLEGQSFTLKTKFEDMFFDGRKTYLTKVYGKSYYYLSNFVYSINCFLNIVYLLFRGKKTEMQINLYRLRKTIAIFK